MKFILYTTYYTIGASSFLETDHFSKHLQIATLTYSIIYHTTTELLFVLQ